MVELFMQCFQEAWSILARMSPYLLLGFLLAGLLSVLFTASFVREHLGSGHFSQIVKASLFGVPLPLCSCGVLPVAASLRSHGASRGATLSFLTSTPQTGVDSIMITYGLLGPVFAVVRVVVAFLSGVLCGAVVEKLAPESVRPDVASDAPPPSTDPPATLAVRVKGAFRHGFVTIAGSIARPTLLGVLLAGAITTFVPEDIFLVVSQNAWLSMLAMLAVGIPLYVCSSGSVPLAYAFIALGISPGAALVFLIVGPATNMATVATVWNQLGPRCVTIYLASLTLCAIVSGLIFDLVFVQDDLVDKMDLLHMHTTLTFFEKTTGVVLLLLFVPKLVGWSVRRKACAASSKREK